MGAAKALGLVPGARVVGEGIPQAVGRSRGACAEAEGSCCSPAAGSLGPSWEVDTWKEAVGVLEGALQAVDRHAGGMVGLEEHSRGAWGHKRDLLSSSWTAGSGSPLRTCTRRWWTSGSWRVEEVEGDGAGEGAGGEVEHEGEEEPLHFLALLLQEELVQEEKKQQVRCFMTSNDLSSPTMKRGALLVWIKP